MPDAIDFILSENPIETADLTESMNHPSAGAVATFEGRVRNHNEGMEVSHLEYQAYPALAAATGRRILEEETARCGLIRAQAVHRMGRLEIGDCAVWVGVCSAHRTAAFDAVRAIMERLKHELPVWKKETYADGRTEWVEPAKHTEETGSSGDTIPEWPARLLEIWISGGNDFRGRHGQGRLEHEIRRVAEVECVAGMGLRGDRYFGFKPDYKGQVTFISSTAIEALRERFSLPDLSASVLRRNLVVEGVDLGEWKGKRFRFQGIEFEGTEECKPCYWMDEAVAPGAEDFMKENFRGGLRAKILGNGVLRAV